MAALCSKEPCTRVGTELILLVRCERLLRADAAYCIPWRGGCEVGCLALVYGELMGRIGLEGLAGWEWVRL
jgi:hypothetical protein